MNATYLDGEIDNLEQQRTLISSKLNELEKQRIIETRAEEKFRLEQLIKTDQAAREEIDRKLEMLRNKCAEPKQSSPAKLGPLFDVPDPPPNHFDRPEYLDQIRAAVLQGDTQAVGITGKRQHVGVQGMGGLGKSVLAAALAHDEAVRAAFPDGIFWLRFRRDADDAYLLEQQAEILKIIAPGQLPDTLVNGENLLTLALENKRCLFIADDIWDSGQLYHFKLKSKGCRLLLTTRNAEVIKKINAVACELALLSEPQARKFLAVCSGCAENDLPEEAAAIVQECGHLPLAIAAIGSMVRDESVEYWRLALKRLQTARLDKIPANVTINYKHENLLTVFQVSVEALPPEVQAYYKTLLVFPEDARIPQSVLQLYWKHNCQGDDEPLEIISILVKRSLLSRIDDDFVQLHDLLRDYLKNQSGGDVASLHKQLLEAYKAKYPGGWHTIPYEPPFYFLDNWIFHAKNSGDTILASTIAESLIWHQPRLHMFALWDALNFVDYDLEDIANDLLKFNKSADVLDFCGKIVADKEAEAAKQRAEECEKKFLDCINQLSPSAKNILSILYPERVQIEQELRKKRKIQ
jgi:hypothetical protein